MRRLFAPVTLALAALVLGAPAAWAHVTISPDSAPAGSDAVLTFNVPTESDTASTMSVEVVFPTDHAITGVHVQPKPGWEAEVETTKLAKPITTDDGEVTEVVSKVTWTGGKVAPGQFDQFVVSAGLPDADSLEFKVLQAYDDGTVERWIESTPKGGPEPEEPAPVLALTKTSTASDTGGTASSNLATTDDVDRANTLAVVAIVVGAVALVLAVVVVVRRRPHAG